MGSEAMGRPGVPYRQVEVSAPVSSFIVEMKVKEGDVVKAGQPLAQLFSGEVTAFVPRLDPTMKRSTVSASTEIYYTFPNSLMLNGSYLFNSAGMLKPNGMLFNPQSEQLTAKTLSPARHSLFAEASYQISPLSKGDVAGISIRRTVCFTSVLRLPFH